MKKLIFTLSLAVVSLLTVQAQSPVKTVTGNINGTVNWSNDTIYLLQGKVYVKSGATLNIEAGTIIKGDKNTVGSAMIVTRGAKLYAVGTPTQPIVFTSSETPGNRATGDWGGLVIAGNARTNIPGGVGTFEGGNLANPDGTASDGQYGGLNDLDNSGELKYVRIEYAGFAYASNSELNSLTMGGVGSGTKISYVQCSHGFDDAFEWFGGSVNCDHLIAYRGNDDDFDTDFGFSGKVQFAVALRDTAVGDAVSGANGFESDNDGNGSANGPKTSCVFSNVTLVGPYFTPSTQINTSIKRGLHIRKNSELSLFNSIVMGWPVGIKLDGDSCHNNADNNKLVMKNNMVAACPQMLDSTTGAPWNMTPWFAAGSNTTHPSNSDVMLTNPFSYTSPDFRPATGSPASSGASFTDAKLATGFTSVNYRGAFGTDDWTAGWSNFRPDTNSYLSGLEPVSTRDLDKNILATNIYPNPTTSNAFVQIVIAQATNFTFELVDLNGTVLTSYKKQLQAGSNTVELNTATLSNGIYFVKISSDKFSKLHKLSVIN